MKPKRPEWATPGTRLGFTVAWQDFVIVASIPKPVVHICDRVVNLDTEKWVKHRYQGPSQPLTSCERAQFA